MIHRKTKPFSFLKKQVLWIKARTKRCKLDITRIILWVKNYLQRAWIFILNLISQADLVTLKTRNFFKYNRQIKFSATWILLLGSALLAWFIVFGELHWFYEWRWIGGWLKSVRLPKDSSQLFFSIGAITGAMLAIVFAFTSQLISRSTEAFSTRFFRDFARDVWIDLSYISLGSITLAEFIFGAISSSSNSVWIVVCIRAGLFLLLSSVVILYLAYTRLINLLDNDKQIIHIAKLNKKKIDEISYLANRVARISYRGRGAPESAKLALESNAYQQQLQSHIKNLLDSLDGLIEQYFISKERKDIHSAQNYLEASFGIVDAYMLSRQRNTSVSFNPKSGLIAESGVSHFLQTSLEKLTSVWSKALAEDDAITIRKYIRHMQGAARISSTIEHFNRPSENPAYYTAMYFFEEIVKDSIKVKNVNALFEISDAYTQITEMVLRTKQKVDPVEEILKYLQLIITVSLVDDEEMYPVLKNSIDALIDICNQIFTQEEFNERRLKIMQKYVSPSIAMGATSNKSLVELSIANFGDNIFAHTTYGFADELSKKQVEKIVNVSKLVVSIIKKLELLATGIDSGTESMNRSIVIMTDLLLKILSDEKIDDEEKREVKYVLSQISDLPAGLPKSDTVKDFSEIDDFLDKFLQSSLLALRAGQQNITKDTLESIFKYIEASINDENGKIETIDLLRVVNKVKVLGATANILNNGTLALFIADFIKSCEKLYHKKHYANGFDDETHYDVPPNFLRPSEPSEDISYFSTSGLPAYFDDVYGLFNRHYTHEQLLEFENSIWK